MDKQEAKNGLTALENEAAELRKIIEEPERVTRPTKEQRFWELVNGLIWKIDKEKYPGFAFGFRENVVWVEYDSKNRYLWLRHKDIWKVFEDEYSLNYNEIQSFIMVSIEEHFSCKGITPRMLLSSCRV